MTITSLNKNDTSVLKGIAILCILAHNFLHWIDPLNCQENEFGFIQENVYHFLHSLCDYPMEFVNILMSYLGHYGVQIFIFISGYGLAHSYLKSSQRYGSYLYDRFRKLYPLLIVGFLFLFFGTIIMSYRWLTLEEWKSMGYKFLLIHTLVPGEGESVSGPWWFFGLIAQLYLLFPLIFKVIQRFSVKGFVGICLFSYTILYLFLYTDIAPDAFFIMENFPGHLVEFSLGVLFALGVVKRVHPLWLLLATIIFVVGNFYKFCFPLTFLCVTYIFISIYLCIREFVLRSASLNRFFSFYGRLSMFIFAIHGVLRWPFVCVAKEAQSAGMTIVVLLLFMAMVTLVAIAAEWLYGKLLRLIPDRRIKGMEA